MPAQPGSCCWLSGYGILHVSHAWVCDSARAAKTLNPETLPSDLTAWECLQLLYLPGITSLLISTVVLTSMLYFSDHLPRAPYRQALLSAPAAG